MSTPASIQRIYLVLLLGNTLAASFIWGINTIFLAGSPPPGSAGFHRRTSALLAAEAAGTVTLGLIGRSSISGSCSG